MSIGHGVTSGCSVYRLAPGVKYLVIVEAHGDRATELLQQLGPEAVQIVISDEGRGWVFIWPENAKVPPAGNPT